MHHPGPVRWKYILGIILSGILAACSGGGTAIRYYLIDPVSYPAAVTDNQDLKIEIINVNVPQYLERFNLVTRGDENQLFLSESHQWGDNFRKNLLRTMARNIASRLGTNDIGTPINRSMSVPDYRIQVHIEQFERNYDGHVLLIGRWQVSPVVAGPASTTHTAQLSSSGMFAMEDYTGIVSAMRELYGQFSGMIADSITAVDTAR